MRNKSDIRVDQKGLAGSEMGWRGAGLRAVRAKRACREWVKGKGGAKGGCDRRVKRDRSW
jgi:hypothetical protein